MAALWKNNRFGRVCPGFRLGKKFAKGPDALSSNFEESNLVGVSPRDATPTVVEHCHLRTRRLGWIASSNNDSKRETSCPARHALPLEPAAQPSFGACSAGLALGRMREYKRH